MSRSYQLECLKPGILETIDRGFCTEPRIINVVVTVMIENDYFNCNVTHRTNIAVRSICRFLGYYKRLRVRRNLHQIMLKPYICSSAHSGRERVRTWRQYDVKSLMRFWDALLPYTNRYPNNDGNGDFVKQGMYLGGRIFSCIVKDIL